MDYRKVLLKVLMKEVPMVRGSDVDWDRADENMINERQDQGLRIDVITLTRSVFLLIGDTLLPGMRGGFNAVSGFA